MRWLRRIAWTLLMLATLAIFLAGMLLLSLDLSLPALHLHLR